MQMKTRVTKSLINRQEVREKLIPEGNSPPASHPIKLQSPSPPSEDFNIDTTSPLDLNEDADMYDPVAAPEYVVEELDPMLVSSMEVDDQRTGTKRSRETLGNDDYVTKKRHRGFLSALEQVRKEGGNMLTAHSAISKELARSKQQKLHRSILPEPPKSWKTLLAHPFKNNFMKAARLEVETLYKKTFRRVKLKQGTRLL